jgi:predicted nucleotidyltransferase
MVSDIIMPVLKDRALTFPEAVQGDLDRALEYLARLPGIRRVWFFGSAAKGRPLDFRSDLDFAIEGLPATELGRIWSELDQRLRSPVDLVRWEEASEALRAQIEEHGILLHET